MASAKAISTRGRLSPSRKKAMTLSTRGWLVSKGKKKFNSLENENRGWIDLKHGVDRSVVIKEEEEEILSIIKIWLRCR